MRAFARYRGMTNFAINPPIHIRGEPNRTVRSLDDAADFIRHVPRIDDEWPGVLHRLESASSPRDAKEAADAFRAWLEAEELTPIAPERRPERH